MVNSEQQQKLFSKYQNRATILDERLKNLEELKNGSISAIIGGSFKSAYYTIKRALLLVFSVGFLVLALVLLMVPDILFIDEEFKSQLVEDYKQEYLDEFGKILGKSFVNIASNTTSSFADYEIAEAVEKAIESNAEEDLLLIGQFFAFCLIIAALTTWYISRITSKIKKRNSMLLSAQRHLNWIYEQYQTHLEEEKSQLKTYQSFLSKPSVTTVQDNQSEQADSNQE